VGRVDLESWQRPRAQHRFRYVGCVNGPVDDVAVGVGGEREGIQDRATDSFRIGVGNGIDAIADLPGIAVQLHDGIRAWGS
jgi:hypothetical protein